MSQQFFDFFFACIFVFRLQTGMQAKQYIFEIMLESDGLLMPFLNKLILVDIVCHLLFEQAAFVLGGVRLQYTITQ
ncbi:hypothetical protein D3C77_533690 [compost metagenome]